MMICKSGNLLVTEWGEISEESQILSETYVIYVSGVSAF